MIHTFCLFTFTLLRKLSIMFRFIYKAIYKVISKITSSSSLVLHPTIIIIHWTIIDSNIWFYPCSQYTIMKSQFLLVAMKKRSYHPTCSENDIVNITVGNFVVSGMVHTFSLLLMYVSSCVDGDASSMCEY